MINIDKMREEAAASANNVGYCGYCGNYQYLFFHLILDVGWQIKCGECGARTDFYKNINEALPHGIEKRYIFRGYMKLKKYMMI